jgi:Zn finger protein HypA/HybF involved in hydrogenase expression
MQCSRYCITPDVIDRVQAACVRVAMDEAGALDALETELARHQFLDMIYQGGALTGMNRAIVIQTEHAPCRDCGIVGETLSFGRCGTCRIRWEEADAKAEAKAEAIE